MPEEDIKTILRALGKLEGRFDGVDKTLEGVQAALAEIARKNAERDLEAGDHEGRIARLEQWRTSVKEDSSERRKTLQVRVDLIFGGLGVVLTAIYVLHILGVF